MENGQNKSNQNPQNQQNSQNQAKNSASPQASAQNTPTSNMQSSTAATSQHQQNDGVSGNKSGGLNDMLNKAGLNNITDKLQQFGSSTAGKVSSMSTTQKVVGGSLLALGAGWLAVNSMNKQKANRSGGTYIKNSSTAGKSKK